MKKFQTKNKTSNIAKLMLCVVFLFTLFSCQDDTISSDNFPIVVIAKGTDRTDDFYDCVTFKTKQGFYLTYSTGSSAFARAINDTYKVGDTIR